AKGKSLFELLIDIYKEFGFYKESLLSLTRKGKTGQEEIAQMMIDYRKNPPKEINNSEIIRICDYSLLKDFDIINKKEKSINLPKSDVLQFFLKDGSIISVRPSGTEPKIKYYFGVKSELKDKNDFEKVNAELDKKIENIIKSLGLK
ncbi:MAG: phospho-sugar mutase, partial [Bacteroidales bacterium]